MKPIYREKQKTYFILIAVFIIIAAWLVVMVWLPSLLGASPLVGGQRTVVLIAVIVDLVLFWSFSALTIKLTGDRLTIAFGIFRKKFALSEIKECLIENFELKRYWGYGIRFGFDKSIAYAAKGGRGIRLKLERGRDYFFTTDHPEQLLSLIKPRIKL